MGLYHWLGVGAFGKRSNTQLLIANHLLLFSCTSLYEEVLKRQVGITLLQVGLVVGMYRCDGINTTRELPVFVQLMLHIHGSP